MNTTNEAAPGEGNPWPADTYAPTWRVERIEGARVTVAVGYLEGEHTDYSASNRADYVHAAAGEDGGTSHAKVGNTLRLRAIDTTEVLAVGGLRVVHVDPAARTLELAAPVPAEPHDWAAWLAGGGLADLTLDGAT